MLSKHLKAWNTLQSEKKGRILIRQKVGCLYTGENYNALKTTCWKENSQVLTKSRIPVSSHRTVLFISGKEGGSQKWTCLHARTYLTAGVVTLGDQGCSIHAWLENYSKVIWRKQENTPFSQESDLSIQTLITCQRLHQLLDRSTGC